MALTIPGIDDELEAQLRARAMGHGRSLEEEVREMLKAGVARFETGDELLAFIRGQVEPLGGIELEIPSKEYFDDPIHKP